MAEGLSASGGRQGDRWSTPARRPTPRRHDRIVSIAEAVLLSIVALMAAWSGYAAAKWSTESRVELSSATAARTKARADQRRSPSETSTPRHSRHGSPPIRLAIHRRWPWPSAASVRDSASHSTRGVRPSPRPTRRAARSHLHAQYRQPGLGRAKALDRQADAAFAAGSEAGERSDKYIRATVFLASVLFLLGISTQFPLRGGRYALVGLALLLVSPSCNSPSCRVRPPEPTDWGS